MRRTDDYGKPTKPQYRVIDQNGKYFLVFDIQLIGNKSVHEFRIQKITKEVNVYPGVTFEILPGSTLDQAKKRFLEIIELCND